MGLRRPFLLVLAYVYIDIVSPQRLTYYLLNAIPISLIAVGLAVGAWALADKKQDARVAPRQKMPPSSAGRTCATPRKAISPMEASAAEPPETL